MTLQNAIVSFLISLPTLHDSESQRAFVFQVGLDPQLQEQILFGKPPSEFVPIFVAKLLNYGQLQDGRYALETTLEVAKKYVGFDRQADCEKFIQELQTIIAKENTSPINQKHKNIVKRYAISPYIAIAILIMLIVIVSVTVQLYFLSHRASAELTLVEVLPLSQDNILDFKLKKSCYAKLTEMVGSACSLKRRNSERHVCKAFIYKRCLSAK